MAKQEALFLTKNVKTPALKLVSADSNAVRTLYTAAADDAVVKSIMVSSTDTAALHIQLLVERSGVDYLLCQVSLPANSGNSSTIPAVSLLTGVYAPGLPRDQTNNPILPLEAGSIVKVKVVGTITAAKEISVVGVVEEY